MKQNLFKKAVSFFIATTICLTVFSLTGCNKSAKVESFNRVCVQGSLEGTSFHRCINNIQHDSSFQALNYRSNQIFTMKASKEKNNYYLKTVGSLLSEEMQKNHVFDFDYIGNDLVTLEFTDPNILEIAGTFVFAPFLETADGPDILGCSSIQSTVTLHSNDEDNVLFDTQGMYSVEVLDDKYLVVLKSSEGKCTLSIYIIDSLLQKNNKPMFQKLYSETKEANHFINLASNKESLLYVLSYENTLDTFEIINQEVTLINTRVIIEDKANNFSSFLMSVIPSSQYLLLWNNFKEKDEKYMPIQIINSKTQKVVKLVDPPKEGYIPSYVMPYNIDDSQGFFLFYENKETKDTTSTYVEVSPNYGGCVFVPNICQPHMSKEEGKAYLEYRLKQYEKD
ncbi:MAG: hypothetical protein KAH01_02930 [Caldisericia bacterium]|nr:hypothetical protein [Caldisericia bacterium]